jgi:hypothetical protein
MTFPYKKVGRLSLIGLLVLSPFLLFYIFFLNHLEPTEIGFARNWFTGEIKLQEGGWHLTPPWVWVVSVDTRPMRVCVTTAGHGRSSAKLVQFKKEHWQEFVKDTEGWHYYWWYNRFSVNFGYDEEYRGFKDIMRGYAYSATKYPFIETLNEYQP